MYYEVIVATNIEQKLTYESDALLQPGSVVIVPVRNRPTIGAVSGTSKEEDCKYKLKSISVILPFVLSEHCMTFLKWFSEYNLFSLGMALKMMVPFTPDAFAPKSTRKTSLPEKCGVVKINLNSAQQDVAQRLLSKHEFSVDLIDGVTGSGKTEVYLYLVQQRLKENPLAQALILLPEIALTSALMSRFKKYFGFDPLVWHSNMTKLQKLSIWKKVLEGEQVVVVGARSALFLPFANLAMIVIDEEHDPSYKQNEQGFYNARDMAIVRAQIENIPILLVSATPSLETVHNVKLGKFGVEKLASRYANATLPLVKIIDMRQEQGRPVISTPLSDAISSALSKREQVLIFVNQRGYTPLSLCKNCGYKWKCAICDVNLIEHKAFNRFLCHHCGGGREISKVCPECGKENTRISLGIGAERALEAIQSQFPSARCLSISSDTVSSKKARASAMDSIHNNEVDIIIGTQILAKGHHFSNLTVVGVLEADHGVGGCDLRANERTYQLLDQVSGRAGREQKQGNVFIQTYMPSAPIILALANRERDVFYEHELKDRETHSMPPFKSLIAVILSGNVEIDVQKCARRWGQLFGDLIKEAANLPGSESSHAGNRHISRPSELLRAQLLGPVPAPISRLRGKYRYRLLIKADKGSNLQRVIRCLTQRESFAVDVQVDVDPYEFL
ncbi:MAG: primosomal protein N' [Holosporales bacterium]|jgi:primosomal protein N' (replication factor Y)|nr:primosomal protein N' [Holosporales bacterium]